MSKKLGGKKAKKLTRLEKLRRDKGYSLFSLAKKINYKYLHEGTFMNSEYKNIFCLTDKHKSRRNR